MQSRCGLDAFRHMWSIAYVSSRKGIPRGRLEAPTAADPVSEPTINLRIWGLYLRAGYTRATFSRALGAGYQLVSAWDTGRAMPSLAYIAKIATLLSVSTDSIIFGRAAHGAVDHALVVQTLDAIGATPATREAVRLHMASERVRYQRPDLINGPYVVRYAQVYAREVANGTAPALADDRAFTEAVNAGATADAAVNGATVPSPPPRQRRKTPTRLTTTRVRAR